MTRSLAEYRVTDQRRLESLQLTDDTAEIFGQLTLAVHDLNLALRQHFYPAATD